jgi:hypothetical protein
MNSLAVTVYCNDHRVDLPDVWVDPWTQLAPTGDYRLMEMEISDNDLVSIYLGLELPQGFQGALVLMMVNSIGPDLIPAILQWQEGPRLTLTVSDDAAIRAIQRLRSAQI